MIKYCIYKSDPTGTKYFLVGPARDEKEGRSKIKNYLWQATDNEDYKVNKFISLYLFKGKDNIRGKLVVAVKIYIQNSN